MQSAAVLEACVGSCEDLLCIHLDEADVYRDLQFILLTTNGICAFTFGRVSIIFFRGYFNSW